MLTDSKAIGGRLRDVRRSRGFTQQEIARHLGVSRSTVAHLESGRRPLRADELAAIAHLLGCPPTDLLLAEGIAAPSDREVGDLLDALPLEPGQDLRDILDLARALTETEADLGVEALPPYADRDAPPDPATAWQAAHQGYRAAERARTRLALGHAPIRLVHEVLQSLRIRTGRARLPDDVAGLFARDPLVREVVIVNRGLDLGRRRFACAHGLAHAILDRAWGWQVCRGGNDPSPSEIRASAFASAFLLPERGLRRTLETLGKETPGLGEPLAIPGPGMVSAGDSVRIDGQGHAGRSPLNPLDVARIAHHFGVSRAHTLLRLRNLRLITEAHMELLQEQGGEEASRTILDEESTRAVLATLVAEGHARDRIGRETFDARMDVARVSTEDRETLLQAARRVP